VQPHVDAAHHWSADLFVAAVCLRLVRVFFRGRFRLPDWLIWVGLLLAGMPVLAFALTRMICHVAAARRRDEAEHGIETGRIVMTPEGGFTEIRDPLPEAKSLSGAQ
jgi:hypothetical protein